MKKKTPEIDKELEVSYKKSKTKPNKSKCFRCRTRIVKASSYEFLEGYMLCGDCFDEVEVCEQ